MFGVCVVHDPGRVNGGSLATSARRRFSSIHCGINASPAPAIRYSSATTWPLASYSGPLPVAEPSTSPAIAASRSARSRRLPQLCGPSGFLGCGQAAPPGMPEGDARQASAEQPVLPIWQ